MNDNRDKLIELLVSGELTVEQRAELCRLAVADDLVAEEVLDQMWLEPLLRDSLGEDADAFVRRIEATLDCDDANAAEFTGQVMDAWSNRVEQRSRGKWTRFGGGVVLAALLLAGILIFENGSGQHVLAASIQLQHATGDVQVAGVDGQSREAVPGTKLAPGDTLTTSGESSATLLCHDGTRLTVTRDASVSWPAGRPGSVVLNSGAAVVTKTPNRQSAASDEKRVLIETQHASLEAADARLLLATSDRRTDVSVESGEVRFQVSGGESVTVVAGACAVAMGQTVELRRGVATPDEWTEEFESGLPPGWVGHAIAKDLPTGSRGAIGTAALKNLDDEDCHQIWSSSEWGHGLGTVHSDTSLNFVYRFKQADRVQIMTLLRSSMPESPNADIHILQPSDVLPTERWWDIPSNKWYVASIPLSQLSNPVTLDHPQALQVVTAFNFRPQDHACGLVIDRMWLTRGGTDCIEFEPLD
jgi:hypothetical protein